MIISIATHRYGNNGGLRQVHSPSGDATAAILMTNTGIRGRFAQARLCAAFVGVVPRERRSGTSLHGKPALSKLGSAAVRKALLLSRPHRVAVQATRVIALRDRLRRKGSTPWRSWVRQCASSSTWRTGCSKPINRLIRISHRPVDFQHGLSAVRSSWTSGGPRCALPKPVSPSVCVHGFSCFRCRVRVARDGSRWCRTSRAHPHRLHRSRSTASFIPSPPHTCGLRFRRLTLPGRSGADSHQLRTPGGLVDSTRDINSAIIAGKDPGGRLRSCPSGGRGQPRLAF